MRRRRLTAALVSFRCLITMLLDGCSAKRTEQPAVSAEDQARSEQEAKLKALKEKALQCVQDDEARIAKSYERTQGDSSAIWKESPARSCAFSSSELAMLSPYIHPFADSDLSDADVSLEGGYASLPEGSLLGGLVVDRFTHPLVMTHFLRGGETYKFYAMDRYMGDMAGGKVTPDENSIFEECNLMTLSPVGNWKFPKDALNGIRGNRNNEGDESLPWFATQDTLIGIRGNWNALPRAPRVLDPRQKTYESLARAVLDEKGFRKTPINLAQVYAVDLDGDGQEEIVFSATRPFKEFPMEPVVGWYSFVAVSHVVDGKNRVTVIEGDFTPNKASVNESPYPPQLSVIKGILDFDGDGRMEILIGGGYYEGGGYILYKIEGDKAKALMGYTCGV